MGKVYIDIRQLESSEAFFVGLEDKEIILAGRIINSMSINEKNYEYQRYADDYDIHFIFDDCIPDVEFYTVPILDIFSKDSDGGFIGSLGQQFDLKGDSPVCYVNRDIECFIVSENMKEFLKDIKCWKKNLKVYDKVIFYHSKEEAQEELDFFDLSSI